MSRKHRRNIYRPAYSPKGRKPRYVRIKIKFDLYYFLKRGKESRSVMRRVRSLGYRRGRRYPVPFPRMTGSIYFRDNVPYIFCLHAGPRDKGVDFTFRSKDTFHGKVHDSSVLKFGKGKCVFALLDEGEEIREDVLDFVLEGVYIFDEREFDHSRIKGEMEDLGFSAHEIAIAESRKNLLIRSRNSQNSLKRLQKKWI